jgi:hypothetical protein
MIYHHDIVRANAKARIAEFHREAARRRRAEPSASSVTSTVPAAGRWRLLSRLFRRLGRPATAVTPPIRTSTPA